MAYDGRSVTRGATIPRRAFLFGTGAALTGVLLPALPVAADDVPVAGTRPTDGTIMTSGRTISVTDTGVTVGDYVINATFRNPTGAQKWDYGFVFRRSDTHGSRIYLTSDGTWGKSFVNYADDGSGTTDDTYHRFGLVANLNTRANATNDVQFIVTGSVGELLVNGASIAAMDLSENGDMGDVRIGAGFLQSTPANETIAYRNFYVAQPPAPSARAQRAMGALYGPANGALVMAAPTEGIQSMYPNVYTRNGTVSARVLNPYDTARGRWDFGLTFRRSDTKVYRIVLVSDKTWRLVYATKEASDDGFSGNTTTTVASGMVASLRTGATDSNDVTLTMNGGMCSILVNGVRVTNLDLAGNTDVGEVALSTELTTGVGIDGQLLRYEDFTITQ